MSEQVTSEEDGVRLYHNGDLNLAVGSVDDRLLAAVGAIAVLGRVLLIKIKY